MVLGLFEAEYAPIVNVHLSQYSYTPGQHLTGQVSVELTKSYRFSKVVVEFMGAREANIIKYRGKSTKNCYTKLHYFVDSACLFQDESGEKLAVGEHIFPFDFLIPINLPDSFEALSTERECGKVKYWIQLSISNPSLFRATVNKEVVVPIYTPYDGPQHPVSLAEKTLIAGWFCFGSRGTVSWTVKFNANVWMAGEGINLTVFVDNRESTYETKGAYAQLAEHVVLMAKGEKATLNGIKCTTETTEKVLAKQTGLLTMQMKVPSNIQSSCRLDILQCSYTLNVYLDIPYNTDPVVKIPITICRTKSSGSVVVGSPSRSPTILTEYKAPVYSMSSPIESPPAYQE